ncbi:uncharacterized protein ATNIH1004_005258 [Aspergillus tanneri]|uniref:Uncharacterized protein n=1 Tax=Aspergillus tanneri TaxID=1220188 RepID=A0A5M9N460_9EURO|nr:uncharacterized protein ATNIH1004_005258 [Aspergillus tanneri]KAA8649357.1 hypothetical protein ATNIH1004_005258 [Aspergillus tanneri]
MKITLYVANKPENSKLKVGITWRDDGLEMIPQAMKNSVLAVERSLRRGNRAACSDAALKWFKLDEIMDKCVLTDASVDRAREEFRTMIRGWFQPCNPPENGNWDEGEDEDLILAELEFPDECVQEYLIPFIIF